MTREYTALANQNDAIKSLLTVLADSQLNTPPQKYQDAMLEIGRHLGSEIIKAKKDNIHSLYLACTVEDADYLAKGILEVVEESKIFKAVSLACFWNERIQEADDVNAARILRKYAEPSIYGGEQMLVILKSIISGACVVRANLTHLINTMTPSQILVVAPVMYEQAEQRLNSEFCPEISSKFQYVTYAIDNELKDSNVVPGIGGNVYQRLGFDNQEMKNSITPKIIKERRNIQIGKQAASF